MKTELKEVGRILIAKPGLDGHDRGARILARHLKNEGFEVIYTGLHQTPEMIAQAAVQEDVDVLCMSILSGAHLQLLPKVQEALAKSGAADIPIVMGGVIPPVDVPKLKSLGVAEVFLPGSDLKGITEFMRSLLGKAKA